MRLVTVEAVYKLVGPTNTTLYWYEVIVGGSVGAISDSIMEIRGYVEDSLFLRVISSHNVNVPDPFWASLNSNDLMAPEEANESIVLFHHIPLSSTAYEIIRQSFAEPEPKPMQPRRLELQ